MFDFEEALKKLPDSPGVYIMKNSEGEIIYIGKAVSLKNRVRQYFQNSRKDSPKVAAMVSHIAEFEYILTDTEMEALILECNLIKKHKPKYNILLKDDKHYPYIKITVNEEYPRILITRKMIKDGSKYFGPYIDSYAVKETIDAVKNIYPLRSCSQQIKYGKVVSRPCLNYQIKRCLAPCQGNIKREDYMNIVKDIILLLSGKDGELIEKLKEKMQEESEKLNFEAAAATRDKIISIQKIQQKQKIISSSFEDEDVFAAFKGIDECCMEVFFIRSGKLLGRENFFFDNIEDDEDIISQFLLRFYEERDYIPKKIIIQDEIPNMEEIEEYLSQKKGAKVYIHTPKKGEKVKLIKMAEKNAESAIEQRKFKMDKERESSKGALDEIAAILELKNYPKRIEAFDISNIQGTDPVASMVVFEDGKPKNKDYRRFKIKTVEGPNDYKSMEEVIRRRFERGLREREELQKKEINYTEGKFSVFPDLIMMDGGGGQVNIALKVLNELNISIPVCGMVKDEKHRTRGLIYNNNEAEIYKESNAFKLIARIQDEAHRFAITYHRSLRSKSIVSSVLDEIEGIGPKRKRELLKYYKTIDAIRKAPIEDLKKVEGMNEKSAEAVYNYFREYRDNSD